MELTRRSFALVALPAFAQSTRLTAQQIVERIQKNVGVEWKTPTRDVFKAGDPNTPVTGIATTVMSTLSILRRAAAANKNLVITHEPTFWSDGDSTKDLENDAVYAAKTEFIRKNNMVIWRFHDHWHARKPDAMFTGLAQALGWDHPADDSQALYNIPPTTLGQLAKDIQKRLKTRVPRIIGDPNTKVSRAAMNVGATSLQGVLRLLPQADVFVAGEPREWEGPEYVQDAVAAGQKKGMIIIGHQISEDPGMRLCADWLKTFITEVPIEWLPTADPFF